MNQKLLYEGFLNSVKKTPNKLAVKDHKKELTYLELFEKSSQVAFTLSQLNIRKEYIPIIGNKTVESIIGILGIFLSENTYVGLDINQPENRFDHIFSSLESKVLIITDISARLEKELKKLQTLPKYILNLTNNFYDKLFSNSESVSIKDNFINPPKYCSESIAYTLFTSGSTGVPKGVCVSHRAACAALDMFQSHI